tara:strand:+ start:745 stop:1662 length:918 start_codon:yes stop_codon:yes gene_type:complete
MSIAFPLKAILQPTGDVVLGEFLESDFTSVLDGGTGAGGTGGLPASASDAEKEIAVKQQVRDNFDLIKFDVYSTLAELTSQDSSVGKFAQHGGTLYYSTGSSWIALGTPVAINNNFTGSITFGGAINTVYDAATNVTTVTVDLSPTQAEIDATQAGAGLNANGTYTASTSSNYLSTSTSLKQSDSLLDSAIFAERTRAIGVEGTIITDQNTIETNLQNFEYSGHTTAQVTGAGKISIAYDSSSGKFVPTDNLGSGGFIRFTKGNGTRDDIPLTTTFTGNEVISGEVDFFKADGTQDNIDLIVNGV